MPRYAGLTLGLAGAGHILPPSARCALRGSGASGGCAGRTRLARFGADGVGGRAGRAGLTLGLAGAGRILPPYARCALRGSGASGGCAGRTRLARRGRFGADGVGGRAGRAGLTLGLAGAGCVFPCSACLASGRFGGFPGAIPEFPGWALVRTSGGFGGLARHVAVLTTRAWLMIACPCTIITCVTFFAFNRPIGTTFARTILSRWTRVTASIYFRCGTSHCSKRARRTDMRTSPSKSVLTT